MPLYTYDNAAYIFYIIFDIPLAYNLYLLIFDTGVKRHIVGGGNSRLFSVHPPLLIVRYRCRRQFRVGTTADCCGFVWKAEFCFWNKAMTIRSQPLNIEIFNKVLDYQPQRGSSRHQSHVCPAGIQLPGHRSWDYQSNADSPVWSCAQQQAQHYL